jgi:hypothetical protein
MSKTPTTTKGQTMTTLHTVAIDNANDFEARVTWTCSCGAWRNAEDIAGAGAEARLHLRNVKEGLIN